MHTERCDFRDVAAMQFRRHQADLEAGLLQRALERGRIAPQHVERVGAIDHKPRADIAVAVDVQLDVDAAEFRRIEAELPQLAASFNRGVVNLVAQRLRRSEEEVRTLLQ